MSQKHDKRNVPNGMSYTAAQIRYYIDRNTGDTYVTEFVPGMTDGEGKTDEQFNVKDYYK